MSRNNKWMRLELQCAVQKRAQQWHKLLADIFTPFQYGVEFEPNSSQRRVSLLLESALALPSYGQRDQENYNGHRSEYVCRYFFQ